MLSVADAVHIKTRFNYQVTLVPGTIMDVGSTLSSTKDKARGIPRHAVAVCTIPGTWYLVQCIKLPVRMAVKSANITRKPITYSSSQIPTPQRHFIASHAKLNC